MRLHDLVVIAAVAGCGSTPPPAANPELAPAPAWTPAQPTCDEVGILLRGANEDRSEAAGPAKEKAIAAACREDHWSPAVISCVAGTFDAHDCLNQLTRPQREAYDKRIAAWAIEFGSDVVDGVAPGATCFDALHAIELFDPPITDASPERDWEKIVRQRVLVASCSNDAWPAEAMACLRDASSDTATSNCVAMLPPKVHQRLLAVRDLAKSIEALRKTPTKLECKKVAEHHYSDARTKKAVEKMKPADRKTLVAGIRKTLTNACTSETWDESTRACMIADGGEETCFGTVRFGEVTTGTFQMFSIPACAQYAEVVMRFQKCNGAPKETRKAMLDAMQEIDRTSTHAPADQQAALIPACQAAANAVQQVISAYGC